MATASTDLSEVKIAARESGYSLSWLDQLEARLDAPMPEMDEKADGLPELSDNLTGRLHGAIPRPDIPQIGAYAFRTKQEVWGYNLLKLYRVVPQ